MSKVATATQNRLHFWCPGCDGVHGITYVPRDSNAGWYWNGDPVKVTITPSILVQGGLRNGVCHSFVTDGYIRFLDDSTHKLSGQTVELPDWPYSSEEEN